MPPENALRGTGDCSNPFARILSRRSFGIPASERFGNDEQPEIAERAATARIAAVKDGPVCRTRGFRASQLVLRISDYSDPIVPLWAAKKTVWI